MKKFPAFLPLRQRGVSRRASAPYRRVWHLAWPMILSNITVPLLGAVDTAVLGHLPSPEYLSGVAIGASVISMLLWAFGFLRMGTTGLVARAHDSGTRWLLRSLCLAGGLGSGLLLLASPLLPLITQWMNASAEAAPHARDYLQIRLLSAPVALANFALLGFFIGRQDSRTPLAILVTANLLNILLDLLLILALGMGARGAAWASVGADLCSFTLGWWLLGKRHGDVQREMGEVLASPDFWPWQAVAPWRELLRINRDLFFRTCLLLFTLAFFTAQGAAQGDTVLAAAVVDDDVIRTGWFRPRYRIPGGARDRARFGGTVPAHHYRCRRVGAGIGAGSHRRAPVWRELDFAVVYRHSRGIGYGKRVLPLALCPAPGGGLELSAGRSVHRGRQKPADA